MKHYRESVPFLQILCVCLLFGVQIVTARIIAVHSPSSEDKFTVFQKYLELDNKIKSFVNKGIKSILPSVMEASEHINVSSTCAGNMFKLLNGIRNMKVWAFSILDATGKLQDGLFSGNVYMLGDYDQCLATTVHKKNGQLDFRGQYCHVKFSLVMPKSEKQLTIGNGPDEFLNAISNASDIMRLLVEKTAMIGSFPASFGLCVPSGCSREEIEQAVRYFSAKILVNTHVETCEVEGMFPEKQRRGQIIVICICSALGLICVLGSFVEHFLKRKKISAKSTLTEVLLCFSFTRNFQKVMNTKSQDTSLDCLHGIRALTVFYILLGHQFLGFGLSNSSRHIARVADWLQTFFAQIILNATMSPEVFFFIGGLVHSYTRLKKMSPKTGKNNDPGFWKTILLRLIRLYPGLLFALMMAFSLIGRGPQSQIIQRFFAGNCEKNWWTNLLFISNYINYEDMCMPQTWYISVDFQIFIVAFFSVSLLLRNSRIGILVNSALMVLGIVTTVISTWIFNALPSLVLYSASIENMEILAQNYNLPFAHIAPYFAGVLLGYFLAHKKDIKIPMKWQVLGWVLATLVYASTYYASLLFNTGVEFTRLGNAFYFAFARFLYPVSVGWMILCCVTGNGGIINYILSMKIWIPISRISYSLYLLGPILQMFYYANNRSPMDTLYMPIIWHHFGDIVACCLLGLAGTLLSESPVIALMKLFFLPKTEDSKDEIVKNGAVKEHIQIWNVNENPTEEITKNGIIKEQIRL